MNNEYIKYNEKIAFRVTECAEDINIVDFVYLKAPDKVKSKLINVVHKESFKKRAGELRKEIGPNGIQGEELLRICEDYGLSATQAPAIAHYLRWVKFPEIYPMGVHLQNDPEDNNSYLIRIAPDTTIAEIKDVWGLIRTITGKESTKRQSRYNLERDLNILKEHNSGVSTKVISEKYKIFDEPLTRKIIQRTKDLVSDIDCD